jgi:hypothetical protein
MSGDATTTSAKKKKRPSPEVEAMKMRSLVPFLGNIADGLGSNAGRRASGAGHDGSSTRRERFDGDLFYDRVVPALRYFYEVHCHLNVHKLYVVPDDPLVPEEIRGFALGKRVDNIRARGDFVRADPRKLDALLTLGGDSAGQKFVWKSKKWVFDHQIIPSLKYFKRKHGHLIVPRDYVTPEFEPRLEPHARLFALGSVSHDMRNRAKGFYLDQQPERVSLLDALGFPWETTSFEKWELRDVVTMEWFKKTYGHLSVPTTFTCPSGRDALRTGLPRVAAGSNFGSRCAQIRSRRRLGALDQRVERKLIALNFPRSNQTEFLRRVVLPCVTYFIARNGHLRWDSRRGARAYAIPNGAREVPKYAWGLRLGEVFFGSVRPGAEHFAGGIGLWDGKGCGSVEERMERYRILENAVRFAARKHADENDLDAENASGVHLDVRFAETLRMVKERCEK